jgi:Transcriptional regulators
MTDTTKHALADSIAQAIKQKISAGELARGQKLPTEAALGAEYNVSRPTVRGALKELEVLGLVRTQHGVGTFVTTPPSVRSGIERMTSITDSIREAGKEPGMIYGRRTVRLVLPDESERMGVSNDTEVLELRRQITADGETVAYSYDLIPTSLFPEDFDPSTLTGSVFGYFESVLQIRPTLGVAELHAVESDHVGWGPESKGRQLYVLLDQLQYDEDQRLIMYSRSYFIEGRYAFVVIRRA